ncbi:SPASM domain-containing protein [candidate division KSB1 bacterium]|nr:SPASM domain-containing protein [candidate division KSB1 bacterium]
MRDSYHQYEKMIEFAKQFSPNWRLGAAWLFLSAFGDVRKNAEIRRQRLDPKQVIDLEHNIFRDRDEAHKNNDTGCKNSEKYLLKNCILERNSFHIDPYGGLTFCSFIFDPRLRYDLKNGTFQKGWEAFLPSLVDFVRADETYQQNCGSCRYRSYCWNCPAYSYLENRNYTNKTDYLCSIARENQKYIEKSRKKHIRIFSLAGVKVQLEAELPFLENTLSEKLRMCEIEGTGTADIIVHHYFIVPDIDIKKLGKEIYRDSSWKVFQRRNTRVYFKYSNKERGGKLESIMLFNPGLRKVKIYHVDDSAWKKGNISSLTLFSEDQIILSPYFNKDSRLVCHAKGLVSNGKGLLLKGADYRETSLIMSLFHERTKFFSDNYFILWRENNHIKMIDFFSPGKTHTTPDSGIVLTAVYFISLSQQTQIIRVTNRRKILEIFESCLYKPFIDREKIQIDNILLNEIFDNVHFFKLNYNINDNIRYCLDSQSKLYYYHIFEGLFEREHPKPNDVLRNELNSVRQAKNSGNIYNSQQRDFKDLQPKRQVFYLAGLSIQVDFNWPDDEHLLDIRFQPFQSEKPEMICSDWNTI